jgi:membrane protease YdiL (CAAX protease family)
LALALVARHYFWDQGTLVERLAPRWGDLSIGAISAMVLLMVSWLGRSALAPAHTPRRAWLYRVYLQLGDPELLQHSLWLTSTLLVIAVAEELVWRGLVLDLLTARLGSRRGWIASTLLYTLSLLPTVYLLRDPSAGLNPLLPTAALGAGLVWSFLAARLGRLPPVAISHMAFTYFTAVQFRWPGN